MKVTKCSTKQLHMNDVDQYIAGFDHEIQSKLQEIRTIIRNVLMDAEEVISYGLPTYKIKGKNIVHFGGFKQHIGFYPVPSAIAQFKEELSKFKGAKGSVQFPYKQELPKDLIERMTLFRLKEHQQKHGL